MFQCIGHGKQLFLPDAGRRQDVCHLRFAAGDGACLIQGNDIYFARLFQRDRCLEQDAVFRSHAVAHHDGHRCGQTQGAGTADHQHRDSSGKGKTDFLPGNQPDEQSENCDGNHRRHENAGHPVRHLGNGRFGGRRIADHLDDLGEGGIFAHPGSPAADEAGLIGGGRRDGVSRLLVHGDALPCQRGLIHRAGPLQHNAVHRDILAGTNHEEIADLHLVDRDFSFFSFPKDSGRLRRQLHQTFERVGGPSLGAGLQRLAHGDQGKNHGRRLEIKLMHVAHNRRRISLQLRAAHGQQSVDAVAKRSAGAHGHQGIHVWRPVDQPFKTADKKLLIDHHDDDRQQHLQDTHRHVIAFQYARQGPAPHGMSHGQVHQGDQEA